MHEMAHNFGIQHDNDQRHGGAGNPCEAVGFMGGNSEMRWSECSVTDFRNHYESRKWGESLNGEPPCLKDISGTFYNSFINHIYQF